MHGGRNGTKVMGTMQRKEGADSHREKYCKKFGMSLEETGYRFYRAGDGGFGGLPGVRAGKMTFQKGERRVAGSLVVSESQ